MLGMKVGDNGKTLDTMGNFKMLGDIRKKCLFISFYGGQWEDVEMLGNVREVGIFLGDKET
jgi:hypothetical protein